MNDQNNPQATTETEIPNETRAFLESLLEDTNMQFTSGTEKEEILQQLYAKLDYYLTARIVESLPEDSLEAFTQMNEEGKTRDDVEAFIMEKIPNAQELFKNAFIEFRDLYVGASNEAIADQVAAQNPVSETPSNSAMEMKTDSTDVLDVPPPPPAPLPQSDEDAGSSSMSN